MKLTRISALLVAALLPLASCDDGNADFGRFQGQVTGEFDADLDGTARSGITPGFEGDQDQILLTDPDENVQIAIFHQNDQFFEGVESVGPDDGVGVTAAIFFEDDGRAFIATSGTMDITEITSDGLRGNINFSAIEFDLVTGQTLNDQVSVDVAFNTDFSNNCCFNRVPLSGTVRLHKTPAN